MSICLGRFCLYDETYNKPYWMSGFATDCPTSGQQVTKNGGRRPTNSSIFNDIETLELGPILALTTVIKESQRITNNGYRPARSN
jgi:hypothetical protein